MLTNTTLLQLLFLFFMVRFEWAVMEQQPPDTGSDAMKQLFRLLAITAASPPVGILAIILTAAINVDVRRRTCR